MSSPSTTPVSGITKDWDWLKTHAILLVLVVGLAIGAFNFLQTAIQKHDLAEEAKYNSLLSTQAAQTTAMQQQLTAEEAHWTQVEQTLLAQNASLAKTIATRNVNTQALVKTDATLDTQQTAARISTQTKAQAGEVTAQAGGVLLDLPVARDITADLDTLAGTQADLTNTETQLKNETDIADNQRAQLGQQTTVITGLQAQNVEQVKACAAEVGALKAEARKSKVKAFFKGLAVGAGVVAYAILGHKI